MGCQSTPTWHGNGQILTPWARTKNNKTFFGTFENMGEIYLFTSLNSRNEVPTTKSSVSRVFMHTSRQLAWTWSAFFGPVSSHASARRICLPQIRRQGRVCMMGWRLGGLALLPTLMWTFVDVKLILLQLLLWYYDQWRRYVMIDMLIVMILLLFSLFSLRLLRLCSCVRSIFFIIAIHMSRVIVMYICITIITISIRALRITINIAVVIIVKLLIGIISFKFIIWSILFVLLLVVLVVVSD